MASPEIAVVGSTGIVGQEILSALLERSFPAEHLTLLGSQRSEGTEVEFGEETLEVERATPESFRGLQLVIFATPPEASRELGPAAQAQGAWVVDASAAFRDQPEVPVVLPALGPVRPPAKGRIVRLPTALSSALAMSLDPLRRAFGLVQVEATALLAVSSAGQRGVGELEREIADLLSGREPEGGVFPHRIGFNLIPHAGGRGAPGVSQEELWAMEDLRALWPQETPASAVTAIQVPTFFGHLVSISARLSRAGPAEDVRGALRSAFSVKVVDSPDEGIYPMPMTITADAAVHVGRIRVSPESPAWVRMVAVIDNAGRGAALNAVELGEALLGTSLGDGEEAEDLPDEEPGGGQPA